MAEREEGIVNFLVQKVGETSDGCTLDEVISHLNRLCGQDGFQENYWNATTQASPAAAAQHQSPVERIWKRLNEASAISVGLGRQFNGLTLADLRARYCRVRVHHVGVKDSHGQAQPAIAATTEQIRPTLEGLSSGTLQGQVDSIHDRITQSSSSQHYVEDNASDDVSVPGTQGSRRSTRSASVANVRINEEIPRKKAVRSGPPRRSQQPNNHRRAQGSKKKYLPGTEGFWNEVFWRARNACEGVITPRYNAGIATHPAAQALWHSRPAGIDEVVLRAIKAGLPVPAEPEDITGAWITRALWVLDRSRPGVYISPLGTRRIDSSRRADHFDQQFCQILVVKSERLREVDFSEREHRSSLLCSITSASHTLRRQGFFSSHPTISTGMFGVQSPNVSQEKNHTFMIPPVVEKGLAHERGRRLEVFQHDDAVSTGFAPPSRLAEGGLTTQDGPERRHRDSMASNDMSSASPRHATIVGFGSPPPFMGQRSAQETPSRRDQPPPLTTRNRKRKVSDLVQAAKPSTKRRKKNASAEADAEADGDDDVLGSLPSQAVAAEVTPPTTSDAMEIEEDPTEVTAPTALPIKEAQQPAKKTRAPRTSREDSKDFIKQILLEVIEECGGMVPHDFLCFSDYLNQKWRAAGKSGQVDKKRLMDAVKALCTSGKIKKLTFTFQKKSGLMALKSILTNVEVDATGEAAKRLQQNIINALPGLYVPPLGSVLNAPSIEASDPGTGPKVSQPNKKASGDKPVLSTRAARRSRTKHGARKDIFGVSPARRPFLRQFTHDLTPIQNMQDALAPDFGYLAANQTGTGNPMWLTTGVRTAADGEVLMQQNFVVRKFELGNRTRAHRSPAVSDHRSSRAGLGNSNQRFEKARRPLTFTHALQDDARLEDPPSTGMPKFGRSSRGRKITWKTKDSEVLPPSLPSSLSDILDMPGQIPTIDYSMTDDPDTNFFFWELDAVEYWEVNIVKIYQQQASDWIFINHISKMHSLPDLQARTALQWEEPEVLTTAAYTPLRLKIKARGAGPKPKTKFSVVPTEHVEDESVDSDYDPTEEIHAEAGPRTRQRRLSQKPIRRPKQMLWRDHSRRQTRKMRDSVEPAAGVGRPRILKTMSTAEIYRIVVSVVVVRTLVGGITGEIDWSIVQRLCPNRDEAFLTERWQTLIVKNRRDINNLVVSMQDKYIEAYENGHVPGINFDDIHKSDWEAILVWAEQHLDTKASLLEDHALPSTRTALLQKKTFAFDEPPTMREPLAYTGNQIRALKDQILASIPAAIPLQINLNDAIGLRLDAEEEEENHNLSLAKSWAVSTVQTPEGALDTAAVTKKLSGILPNKREADKLFDKALKALQRNLVIKRNRGNSGVSQGGWRLSERWFEMFDTKRMITASMLKTAAAWKRDVLDVAFARGQVVDIQKTQLMQDGEMVAILNLVANGRCKITPGSAGLPRGRYGLDPEATSYSTLGMSRLHTLFATAVRPVQDRYVAGDPMGERRHNIPTWQDGGRGKIPCWIDMNGNLLMETWQMVVSATVGLLSGRPGLQALEIERSLGHGLSGWEVETVLSWLAESGFAQRTAYGMGWETEEWWWMVCGY